MNRIKKLVIAAATAGVLMAGLTACTTAASPLGMCGWVVGNGSGGNDRNIHETVYEGENPDFSSGSEEVQYVPCGPRNFRVTDGSEVGLDGAMVGDVTTPYEVVTADVTPVRVQVDAFWQLNQSEEALSSFKELCNKYTCYTTDTNPGTVNAATPGWNLMLSENFSPAMKEALKIAMREIPDDIWATQDLALYDQLEAAMSEAFMDTVRAATGYNVDLFCGSGNSGWSDPEKPGTDGNAFTCTNVRFEVRTVEAVSAAVQESASAQSQEQLTIDANTSRYNSSVPLYGNQTNFWLGVQDAVSSCRDGATCNFYLGDLPSQ